MITLQNVNRASEQMDIARSKYRRLHHRCQELKKLLTEYTQRNEAVLHKSIRYRGAYLVAILSHMAFGLAAAVTALPLLLEIMGQLSDSYWVILIFSTALIGFSISVGTLFHRATENKTSVRTDNGDLSRQHLIAAVVFAILYLGILLIIVMASSRMIGSEDLFWTKALVIAFGIAELFVGYFALLGYEVLWISGILYFKRLRLRLLVNKKDRTHLDVQRYRAYSQQLHELYNHQNFPSGGSGILDMRTGRDRHLRHVV